MTLINSLWNNKKFFSFIFYTALIVCCYLFFSQPAFNIDVAHSDKYGHIMVFFTLAMLLNRFSALRIKLQILLLTGFGISVEIVQSFIPYRSGSVDDVVADILGLLLFYGLLKLIEHFSATNKHD
ncbi:MAG: VanZ family protein [Gammaproteobacteria bacterium]|nr:VanZ family protein [Gammaproteobacteria bacterium]